MLLIVCVLIESHNEMSGADITAHHPAARGSPYMETELILDWLITAAGVLQLTLCGNRKCCRVAAAIRTSLISMVTVWVDCFLLK